MQSKDIEEVKSLLNMSKESPQESALPFNPVEEVQDALTTFLKARLTKLQEDSAFEEQIKRMISAKLPEATFSELLRLLDIYQANSNTSVEKVLSPFIPRAGDRVPALDDSNKGKKAAADAGELSKDMSKDMVQAFQELSSVLNKMKERSSDIKEALT